MPLFCFSRQPLRTSAAGIAFWAVFLLLAGDLTPRLCPAADPPKVLTLEQAIDMALERNRSIQSAQNAIDSAGLSLDSARSEFDVKARPFAGAGLTDGDEDVSTGVALSKTLTQGMRVSVSPHLFRRDGDYGSAVTLGMDIPLFRYFGELVNTQYIRSSEYALRSTERSLTATRENMVLETIAAFYHILEQKKNVEMNRFLVARFRKHAAVAQLKTDIGLAQPLDVYRSQIQEKDAEVSLTDSLESLQNAQDRLKSLLAIPQSTAIDIRDASVEAPALEMKIPEVEAIAFAHSIQIKGVLDDLNERRRAVRVAEHYLLPDLTLSADYTRSGRDEDLGGDVFRSENDSWRLFLTSSTDFARTTEKNAFRQSLIALQSTELALADAKDQLSREIRSQMDTLEKTRERIGLMEAQIHNAMGKLELAEIKFNNGMASNFDMIEAETEHHRAKLQLLSARIDYIIGVYRLRKIIGTLIDQTRT